MSDLDDLADIAAQNDRRADTGHRKDGRGARWGKGQPMTPFVSVNRLRNRFAVAQAAANRRVRKAKP